MSYRADAIGRTVIRSKVGGGGLRVCEQHANQSRLARALSGRDERLDPVAWMTTCRWSSRTGLRSLVVTRPNANSRHYLG